VAATWQQQVVISFLLLFSVFHLLTLQNCSITNIAHQQFERMVIQKRKGVNGAAHDF
jgi:hypothetical protein